MRILIADDHRLVMEGVRLKLSELGANVQFSLATTVDELYAALRESPPPNVALIDLAMPGAQDHRHISAALQMQPEMRVLILSGCEDSALMHTLIDLGAHGFIPKAYSPDVMLSAVRLVLSGGVYIPPMALNSIHSTSAAQDADPNQAAASSEPGLGHLLTERQIDVLHLLCKGNPNKVIARDLGISEGTVKIHLAAIFRALNVRNRVEAVVAAQHMGNA